MARIECMLFHFLAFHHFVALPAGNRLIAKSGSLQLLCHVASQSRWLRGMSSYYFEGTEFRVNARG